MIESEEGSETTEFELLLDEIDFESFVEYEKMKAYLDIKDPYPRARNEGSERKGSDGEMEKEEQGGMSGCSFSSDRSEINDSSQASG